MGEERKGYTLVEVLAVLCIVGLVCALGAPRLDGQLARMRVRAASTLVAADLAFVKMLAVRDGHTAVLVIEPSAECSARLGGRAAGFRYRIQTRAQPGAPPRVVNLRQGGGRVCMEMNGSDTLAMNSRGLPHGFTNRTIWVHDRRFADTLYLSVAGRVRRGRQGG
jgi:prepilin-type N-terminal cleavage/methylation domain-containing protein